jgi:hypothetical protein
MIEERLAGARPIGCLIAGFSLKGSNDFRLRYRFWIAYSSSVAPR